jgi:hypothetical protein
VDPLLREFAGAPDGDADRLLGELLASHAAPVVRRIAATRLGGGAADVDDVQAQVLLDLMVRLRQARETRDLQGIDKFTGYTRAAQQPFWIPLTPLARQKTYAWQVSTVVEGKTVVAPGPSRPPARFFVLPDAEAKRLAALPPSHLVRGVLFGNAGLLDEAAREFKALREENPDAPAVATFLRQVESRLAAARTSPR